MSTWAKSADACELEQLRRRSYFVDPGGGDGGPLAAMIGSPSEAEILGPVTERVEPWEAGTVLPGLDVTMAPGHTPGSTVIIVSSGTARAFLLGDVAHCPVELVAPEMGGPV